MRWPIPDGALHAFQRYDHWLKGKNLDATLPFKWPPAKEIDVLAAELLDNPKSSFS